MPNKLRQFSEGDVDRVCVEFLFILKSRRSWNRCRLLCVLDVASIFKLNELIYEPLY